MSEAADGMFWLPLSGIAGAAFLYAIGSAWTGEQDLPEQREVLFYLVRERWHTGIVLPRNVAERCFPEARHLPPSAWVDIGWGEADFYQTPGFDLRLALKAIFRHNRSVLRLAAVPADLQRFYGEGWLLPLCLDSLALERLCLFLFHSVPRDSSGGAFLSSIHAGGWVRFYHARGTYWGLQTCNTWVARALRSAGLPLPWHGLVLAEQLFALAQRYRCPTSR